MLEERLAFTSCPLLLVCLSKSACDGEGEDEADQLAGITAFLRRPIIPLLE